MYNPLRMDVALLTTKLFFPPARINLVPRPRLIERLALGLTGPLTLISAPAGYGKTTLLSEWRASNAGRTFPIAWLSLDPDDNELTRFLAYLIAAIGTIKPGFGEDIRFSLQDPQPPATHAILTNLVNELGELDFPFGLALDDYHVITNQPIHDALAYILDHLPPPMHLVMLSRADPPLPLARLRARNKITEIRAKHLCFSPDEAETFLRNVMGLALSNEDVDALERRTEGWAAGLQLAALSLQGRGDPGQFIASFEGGSIYIVDYLVEEVLNLQSESLRTFLQQTSILDRLSGSLCEAITGQAGGQATLEQLERANLFVTPLGSDGGWYRYHSLFADVMRNRLRRKSPAEFVELNTRAARWFERNGAIGEAIHHALAANDRQGAALLVEQNAMSMLMMGELVTLSSWISAVGAIVHERPWLGIYQSWVFLLTGQLENVEPILQEAERNLQANPAGLDVQDLLGNIAAIRAYGSALRGDAERTSELARRALEVLPENNLAIRAVVHLALGGAGVIKGDLAAATEAFREASYLGRMSGNQHATVAALGALAGLLSVRGQLHASEDAFRQALRLATSSDGKPLPLAARAHAGLARIFYEWNKLENAEYSARQCLELGQKWDNADTLVTGYVMLARISRAQGDLDSEEESLLKAEQLLQSRNLTPSGPEWVEMTRLSSWLRRGNLEACNHWVQERGFNPASDILTRNREHYFMYARVLIAREEFDTASHLLEWLLVDCEADGRWGSVIEVLVQRALAWQGMSEIPQALQALERALALAATEGYLRVFLDAGEPLARLLRYAGSKGIAPKVVSYILSEFDKSTDFTPITQQPLIEPLSERELEVLRLMAAGNSNQEIAAQLVLSSGTVKSHLSHIYSKLNVNSRTQCLARVRELKILT
jgi:LuxR family maltose regulon positive regulatory protein